MSDDKFMNQEIPQQNQQITPPEKSSTAFKSAILILVIVAVWILSGYLADKEPTKREAFDRNYDVPKVRVATLVAQAKNEKVELYGITEAAQKITLNAEVEGKVEAIVAKEGESIKKGDAILHIEKRGRNERLAEAKARVKQREMEYKSAKALSARGFQAQTKLAAAKADLEMSKAEEAQAWLDVNNTTIRAPFDGVVEKLDVEVGELVGTNLTSSNLGTFVNNHPVIAVGSVSERDILEIEEGLKAIVRLTTGDEIEGKVTYVANVADEVTRTFRVEVEIENEFDEIPIGATTEIIILTGEEDAHFIPTSALSLNHDGQLGVKTFRVDRKGELKTAGGAEGKGFVDFHAVLLSEDTGKGMWVFGLPDVVHLIVLGHAFVDAGDIVVGVDGNGNPVGVSREKIQ